MADREPDPPPPNPPHNERKPNILIIGSLNIDLTTTVDRIPEAGETMHAVSFNTNSGGKGANQAVAVGRGSRSKPASSLTIDEGTGLASTFGLASTYSLRAEEVDGGVGEVNVAMLGAVGNDIYGSQLVEDLKASGVDTANIRKIEGTPTGTAVIIVDQSSGENRIMLVAGANDEMDIASTRQTLEKLFEQEETRPDVIIFQLEIPLETVEECIRFVKERKEDVEIILNAAPAVENLDSVFSLEVDHLIVNETEISLLLGSPTLSISNTNDKNLSTSEFETWKSILLPWKFKKDIKFLIVTLGSKGVLFFASSPGVRIERYYPAMEVQDVVDTTAAGDTFVGVYGVGIAKAKKSDRDGKLKWEDVEGVVLKANRVAAVTITRRGAMGSIPWRDGVV